MGRWVRCWLDRLFAVMGALLFAQAPLYMLQYTQEMAGRVEELRWQYQAMEQAAQQSQKTLVVYVEKFLYNQDEDIARQGKIMKTTIDRYERFQSGLSQLRHASVFTKPFVFLQNVNTEIAKNTLAHFEPGLSLTLEGAVYAFLGIIFGYGFFSGISKFIASFFLLFKKPANI